MKIIARLIVNVCQLMTEISCSLFGHCEEQTTQGIPTGYCMHCGTNLDKEKER